MISTMSWLNIKSRGGTIFKSEIANRVISLVVSWSLFVVIVCNDTNISSNITLLTILTVLVVIATVYQIYRIIKVKKRAEN